MATVNHSVDLPRSTTRKRLDGYPADSRVLDWLSVLTSAWFIAGLFLDGWAHNHIPSLETFFTPWHGVLYSGFFAVAAVIGVTQYRNVSKGYVWSKALPQGYFLSLVGVALFLMGGVGDMLWHEIFGIEQNLEALFSPTHLLLASGAFLFLSGPLRAAWRRRASQGWSDLAPAILSLTMLFTLFTFFTQYANVFGSPGVLNMRFTASGSQRYFTEVTSVAYVFFPAALMMGTLLFALRRWQLPFGAATFMFTVNALLMVLMRFDFAAAYWYVIVAAAIGGLFTDVLIAWLHPSVERPNALRLFSFMVPFVFFLLIFGAIVLTGRGLWWQVHTWLGVPFLAGVIGVFLSLLLAPPKLPEE